VVDLLEPGAQVGKAIPRPALLLQVGTGGEAAPGAGDQQGAEGVVPRNRLDRVEQVAPELLVPGVERFGTVEQDASGGPVHGQVDRLV
jgi:hypothetical protein